MPYCDVPDMFVFTADFTDCCLETAGETLFRGFELRPAVVELVAAFSDLLHKPCPSKPWRS